MNSTIGTKLAAAILAFGLIAVPLSACSADGGDAAARGDGSSTTAGAEYDDFASWQLAFAKCMRGKGVDMPDPDASGNSKIDAGAVDGETFQAASSACAEELGPPPAAAGEAPKSDQEGFEELLKAAQCIRDAGYDIPDPSPETGMPVRQDIPESVLRDCAPMSSTGVPGISKEQ